MVLNIHIVAIMLIVRDGRKKERKGQYFNTTEAFSPRPQKSQGLLGTGRRGGRGYGGGGRERLYTSRYTVTTRMTFALRWAAMRAILMSHNCEGQSHKTVSTDHNF